MSPFPILAGLTLCWALATPIFAVPDEPTQVIKAAAVARGELVGTLASGPYTAVQVPAGVVGTRYTCFVFQRSVPASCDPPLSGSSRVVTATTYAGRYPPLYYALVGWPTLLVEGDLAIYLMRGISALLAALFLAGAFRSAASSRSSRLLVVALAAVVTPYVLYFSGSVNPSGLEMPAAICAWTTGLVLVGEPDRLADKRLIVRFGLAMAVLVQLRGLGPLFGAVLLGTLMALFGVRPFARLMAGRTGKLAALAVGLSGAFCVSWTYFVGGLALLGGSFLPPHAGALAALDGSTVRFGDDLVEMVGMFGWWNATFLPLWVYLVWFGIGGGLVTIGLLVTRGRKRLVALALAVVSVALPILLVAGEAGTTGIVGQGRYWLPLIAGTVLVAAYVSRSFIEPLITITAAVVAVLTVAVQVVAFRYVLDRYRFGFDRVRAGAPWDPPAGAVVLTVAFVILVLLVSTWWWRVLRPRPSSRLTTALELTVVTIVAALAVPLAGLAGAVGTTSVYTWTGASAATGGSHRWSDDRNWSQATAPPGSATRDDLVFPSLAQCDQGGDSASCTALDDLGTNEVHSITIGGGNRGGGGYTLTATTGSLALGRGGLKISTRDDASHTEFGIPITLWADQIWQIGAGTASFSGGVYGSSALTLRLSARTNLDLSANVDVGDLNVIGTSGHGPTRARVVLTGSDLNGGGTFPVAMVNVALEGYGHIGPLATSNTSLTIGAGYLPGARSPVELRSTGDVSLDSSTRVTFDDLGSVASRGVGYPQLRASGSVTLSSAVLQLNSACSTVIGDSFTIVRGASVSGTFASPDGGTIADNDVIEARSPSAKCTDYFKITYKPGTVTATQVASR